MKAQPKATLFGSLGDGYLKALDEVKLGLSVIASAAPCMSSVLAASVVGPLQG